MFNRQRRAPWPPTPEEDFGTRFKAIISNITEVVSGGILRAGKTDYGSGTGWWLGIDPADDQAKFDIGTPSNYFRFDETNGVQIAADGSGMTNIDGANIQAGSIVLTKLDSGVTDRMFNTGTLSDNIQAWIHASDATLIDGGDIYTGSILVAGLETGIVERMFGTKATADNIQAWIHASDATLIDGGDIYTGSILIAGLETGIVERMFGSKATADNIQAWVHANDATLIDGGDIFTNTVTATQIAARTITANEMTLLTLTAAEVAIGTLTFDRMISGALSNNLIVNPGFEDGSDPHDLATDGGGTWTVQDTIKRGAYALQHNPSGQSATAHCYFNGHPTDPNYLYRHIATYELKQYNFTFFAYRAAGTTANTVRGYTRFYDAAGSLLNAYYTSFDPSTWTDDTWTECTTSKTAPANAVYVVFAISILDDSEAGSLYFDDADARTKVGSGLIEVDAVLAEHIDVVNLQAVSAQTGALTVDDTLTMGEDGIITWMSGAAKITDDVFDVALTDTNRYAFRFLDGEAVHGYFAGYKSANFTQLGIEVVGPAEDKYAKFAIAAIEFIDEDPEITDMIIRSDTGIAFAALNYHASRIFKVDTMDAQFTNKVHVRSNLSVGDVTGGNYLDLEPDGTLHFIGNATVWDDLPIDIGKVKLPGVSDPTWVAYKGGRVLSFSKSADNIFTFIAQTPHAYKEGSNMEFHLHLAYPNAGTGDTRWVFTHSWANAGTDFPSESTVTTDIASPNDADNHQFAEIASSITGTGKTISSLLICSLMREGTDAVNDDYDEVVYLISADFHYERDTVGSRIEKVKDP